MFQALWRSEVFRSERICGTLALLTVPAPVCCRLAVAMPLPLVSVPAPVCCRLAVAVTLAMVSVPAQVCCKLAVAVTLALVSVSAPVCCRLAVVVTLRPLVAAHRRTSADHNVCWHGIALHCMGIVSTVDTVLRTLHCTYTVVV